MPSCAMAQASQDLFGTVVHASQVDTKDILFICGGAFIDLDRQVSERTHEASLGFGNPVRHNQLDAVVSAPRVVQLVILA